MKCHYRNLFCVYATTILTDTAGGEASVISYAKNLAFGVPPWILYIIAVAMLCEHIGIWLSLTVGVLLYLVTVNKLISI